MMNKKQKKRNMFDAQDDNLKKKKYMEIKPSQKELTLICDKT